MNVFYPPLCQGADGPFMKAFYDKGRVSGLLEEVPIYAVLVEDIGLRGAHFVAARVRYILFDSPV